MKKEPVVQQTDLSVLQMRTTLLKRINLINKLVVIYGFTSAVMWFWMGFYYMEILTTTNFVKWFMLISIVIIIILLICRKSAINRLPYKYFDCRDYRVLFGGGKPTCFFVYHNGSDSKITTIHDYALSKQLDNDVEAKLIKQVSIHYPAQMQSEIPLTNIHSLVAHVQCQSIGNAMLQNLLRSTGITKEPGSIIQGIISKRIDGIVDPLRGADRLDINKINQLLLSLTQVSDLTYQQVCNQTGYLITRVEVKLKT